MIFQTSLVITLAGDHVTVKQPCIPIRQILYYLAVLLTFQRQVDLKTFASVNQFSDNRQFWKSEDDDTFLRFKWFMKHALLLHSDG